MIELEQVQCDLCNSEDAEKLISCRDYRFGRKERYQFVTCKNCGLVYLNPRPDQRSIIRLYEEDYTPLSKTIDHDTSGQFRRLKEYWHILNGDYGSWLVNRVHGRVLEYGCGNGKFLIPLRAKGCEVFGLEFNKEYARVHEKHQLNVHYGSLEEAKYPSGFFDYVIMAQVIEHVPSPTRSLSEIWKLLAPGGKLIVLCPNANGFLRWLFAEKWHGWHVPFHFFVFSRATLSETAKKSGFEIIPHRGVTPTDFFTTSLKAFLYGESADRPIDRGSFLDSKPFRAAVAPFIRLFDCLLRDRQDCLIMELRRP